MLPARSAGLIIDHRDANLAKVCEVSLVKVLGVFNVVQQVGVFRRGFRQQYSFPGLGKVACGNRIAVTPPAICAQVKGVGFAVALNTFELSARPGWGSPKRSKRR